MRASGAPPLKVAIYDVNSELIIERAAPGLFTRDTGRRADSLSPFPLSASHDQVLTVASWKWLPHSTGSGANVYCSIVVFQGGARISCRDLPIWSDSYVFVVFSCDVVHGVSTFTSFGTFPLFLNHFLLFLKSTHQQISKGIVNWNICVCIE